MLEQCKTSPVDFLNGCKYVRISTKTSPKKTGGIHSLSMASLEIPHSIGNGQGLGGWRVKLDGTRFSTHHRRIN